MLVIKRAARDRDARSDIVLVLPDGQQCLIRLCHVFGTGHATIGVKAPTEIKILRGELFEVPADA